MINDECMVNESQEHKRSMPHASWLKDTIGVSKARCQNKRGERTSFRRACLLGYSVTLL
jgi:hypothetical protein